MSPQTAEDGSLAFARNMKIDDDGNLVSDYGYKNIDCKVSNDANPAVALNTYNIIGHIVGLDNKIYFFCSTRNGSSWTNSKIIEYDEVANTAAKISTNWIYSGGEIDGYVNTNQSGEKILTIGEYLDNGSSIPLKHINLNPEFAITGDQTFYSQAPKCPTANLILKNTYVKTIPNGVYVFFIRYKIRKDVYTNWFLCSRPIFGGTSEKITTLQGGLQYINYHKDSAKSFVLQLDFLASNVNIGHYEEFQLGFIITHDEATEARTWKHFNTSSFINNRKPHYNEQGYSDENLIYFDYEDIKEANIDDLLETTYELYNVRNITAFKNKLYISNYIESDFNPTIANTLKNYITLTVAHTKTQGSTDVQYKNMKLKDTSSAFISLHYDYSKGYYDKTIGNATIQSLLPTSYNNNNPFNYDVSKLSKVESKERADVVRFDVFWNGDADPDVAIIHNIYNDLYNKVIFGRDYQVPIPDNYTDSTKIATIGLKLNDSGVNAYIYAPLEKNPTIDDSQHNPSNHPWYNLGLSFGFGSFKADEIGTANYNKGCSVFNAYNYYYSYNYITGRTPDFGVNTGWFSRDEGFGDYAKSTIEGTLQREIEGRSFFAKAYLEVSSGANIYLIDYRDVMELDNYAGNNMTFDFISRLDNKPQLDYQTKPWQYYTDSHLTILDPSLFSTTILSPDLDKKIKEWVYDTIYNKIVGIDENGSPVLNVGTNSNPIIVRTNSISVKFKKFDFSVDSEDIDTTGSHYVKRFKISMKTTDYTSLCTFNIKNSYISITDNGIGAEQRSTLMPLSTYQPYVHFVDEHNIITNGVKLDPFTTGAINSTDDVLYLKYSVANSYDNVPRPANNFKSFFISLVNIGDIVMEGFGYYKIPNSTTHILHCLEIDTMLYNINDSITIKGYVPGPQGSQLVDITTEAKYYSSGSNYPPLAFGNCGFVSWEGNYTYLNDRFYIIIKRNKSAENINDLPKSSSYIPFVTQTTATELPDGYYGSWLSFVKKPSFELSSSCYVSGKDVYVANRSTVLSLTEFKSFIQAQDSITYFIRSNFNLNYLSLTEDITDSIFTVGSASSGVKQVAKVINSATLSFIYELKPMYKSFANKFFRRFDSNYKIDFDNTIRVSNVLSDETFNNSVFKFSTEDYYNVPTDRGIIVSLFAIGSNIFVHTKTAFYKFDGNQTISASNTDIILQESEPFNNGITQLFDSEYGYGGINNKEAGCITFDSYLFYDAMSNHIFAHGGNSQVQLIDASIYKLLCYYKPTYCRTLHDDANHRVFFEFTTSKTSGIYKTFTISYNYKSKSFVSLHDLSLENAFHSRYLSYSYKSDGSINKLIHLFDTENTYTHEETVDNETVVVTTQIDVTPLVPAMNIYKIYGNATTVCFIQFGADTQEVQSSPFNIAVVTFPRETFRECVNNLKYIGDIIQDNYDEKTNYEVIKFPQITRTNPVSKFYVITDRCVSTPVSGDVNDAQRPANPDDYKGFKYDMGSWNTNYFRNAINDTNIYQYPDQPGVNIPIGYEEYYTRHPNTDNNSLVYGKYFILVFDFIKDKPVKFEEINVNSNKY